MSGYSPQKFTGLDVSVVLSRSVDIYKVAFKPIFAVGFVLASVNQLLQVYAQQFLHFVDDKVTIANPVQIIILLVAAAVLTVIMDAILYMQLAGAQLGRQAKFALILQHIIRLLPSLIVGAMLYIGMFVIGFALFILFGLIIMVLCYVYMPIILFDGASGLGAIKRSFFQVRPHFLKVSLLVSISLILRFLPLLGITALSGGGLGQQGFGVEEVMAIFVLAFIYPFTIAIALQTYFALKRASAGL